MAYQGDISPSQILDFNFTTHKIDGTPIALVGGAIKSYKTNSTSTEINTGLTLSIDFDGITGLNHVIVNTSADTTFYSAGDFNVVITSGTVDSIPVSGYTVGNFSISNRSEATTLASLTAIKGTGWQTTDNLKEIMSTASSRFAAVDYIAPNNSAIADIYTSVIESGVFLTADYNAAKTAATQTSLNAIDTIIDNLHDVDIPALLTAINLRLLTSAYTAPDNTSISLIKAKTDTLSGMALESSLTAIKGTGWSPLSDTLKQITNVVGSNAASLGTIDTVVDDISARIPVELIDGKMSTNVAITSGDTLDIANHIVAGLGGSTIVITSPISSTGDIAILRGATYTSDTTTFTVIISGDTVLDGATPIFNLQGTEFTGTLTGTTVKTITWEMSAAQTAALDRGNYRYSITYERGGFVLPEVYYGDVEISDFEGVVN